MTRHVTKHELNESIRSKVIELLNQMLVDAIDLEFQFRQAHWNAKGPCFIALHELFGNMASQLEVVADDLAERVVALGGIAQGTVQGVARESRLPHYSMELVAGRGHLEALSGSVACFARLLRESIGWAREWGDATTVDLLTQNGRVADKWLWLLEAHMQAKE